MENILREVQAITAADQNLSPKRKKFIAQATTENLWLRLITETEEVGIVIGKMNKREEIKKLLSIHPMTVSMTLMRLSNERRAALMEYLFDAEIALAEEDILREQQKIQELQIQKEQRMKKELGHDENGLS